MISLSLVGGLLWGCLSLAAPALGRSAAQTDVVEELWTRTAARSLALHPSREVAPAPSAPGWRASVALLDAYARAGVWAPSLLAVSRDSDSVEVAAAKLRVLPFAPTAADEFVRRLSDGLRSPFRAVRSAAVHRATIWSLERSGLGGRASRLFAATLADRSLPPGEQRALFEVALRSGDGREFETLFALPVASIALESADRAGWDPLLGFFGDIVALPISAAELASLERASTSPGPLACLRLVAHVRDAAPIELPALAPIVDVVSGRALEVDTYELDVVIETMVGELCLKRKGSAKVGATGPEASPRAALGEALLAEAVRPDLKSSAKERCLRAAARLLPVTQLLQDAAALDDDAALVVWDALDRRDGWPEAPGLASALLPWLDRSSVDVREAALRAAGRRYAYGGRADFEGALRKALRDEDPTLRSLSFAWLAKSEPSSPALDAELFAAWEREGSGNGRPGHSERQGRWLAQLPRDRSATLYRGALLDLLSLEGDGKRAVGAGSVELLGGFRGDREVFQRASILLERCLVGIEMASGYLGRLPFDASAARAVRILHRVDAERAAPLIADALRRSMDRLHGADARGDARPQLPKMAVGLLARRDLGRERLGRLLGPRVPRRVRFEAALQLMTRSDPGLEPTLPVMREAQARLIADFDGVDGALRLRAIEALRHRLPESGGAVDSFLEGLTGVGNDEAERSMAIEALGRRGRVGALAAVIDGALEAAGPDAGTIDAAANAARAMRHTLGEPAARAALARLEKLGLAVPERGELSTVRGKLLEFLCALLATNEGRVREGAASWLSAEDIERVLGAVLSAPLEEARTRGAQQFRRGPRIEPQFQWASELACLQLLARRPGLFRRAVAGPMDEASRWGALDGRTLLALARVAAPLVLSGESGAARLALRLANASAVALEGEGAAPDRQRRLAEARWLEAGLASRQGESAAAARAYRSLLGAYRQGLLSRGVLRAMQPSLQRPEVVLHHRYWAGIEASVPSSQAAARDAAWGALLPVQR